MTKSSASLAPAVGEDVLSDVGEGGALEGEDKGGGGGGGATIRLAWTPLATCTAPLVEATATPSVLEIVPTGCETRVVAAACTAEAVRAGS